MTALPRSVSGNAAVRAFAKAGWTSDGQKGSRVTMTKPGSRVVLTVPIHSNLGPGLLRKLIRDSGLSVDEFIANLRYITPGNIGRSLLELRRRPRPKG